MGLYLENKWNNRLDVIGLRAGKYSMVKWVLLCHEKDNLKENLKENTSPHQSLKARTFQFHDFPVLTHDFPLDENTVPMVVTMLFLGIDMIDAPLKQVDNSHNQSERLLISLNTPAR